MTILYVTEYAEISPGQGLVSDPIPHEPAVADQYVTFTTTSVQSAAFNVATRIVMLQPTGNCHVQFASSPTAVLGQMQKLLANVVYWRVVTPGDKVAAVDA